MNYDDFDIEVMKEALSPELFEQLFGQPGENPTADEIQAAIKNVFGKITESFYKPYTLQQCLSFLSRGDLMEIANVYQLPDSSKMKTTELIEALHKLILAPQFMNQVYPSLIEAEADLLKTLCTTSVPLVSTDIIFYATELLRHGLCYMDEEAKHLIMPVELKDRFLQTAENKALRLEQHKNTRIYAACYAAVYFYGVYPLQNLRTKIQELAHIDMSEQEIIRWHNQAFLHRDEFFFKNGYIVSSALLNTPEDIVALQQLQKQKKQFYWPEQEDILVLVEEQWLAKEDVYAPFWDFAPILMDNEFGDVISVSRFVESSIRTGAPFDALIGYLSEQLFALDSEEQIDEFVAVIQNIWDNTPMWENCGYTLAQIAEGLPQKQKQINSGKSNIISLQEHREKRNNR